MPHHIATIANNGKAVVTDFTGMDLLVQCTNSGDTEVISQLMQITSWTVSMSPDYRDPNACYPDETATITFTLASSPKVNACGILVVGTPLGVVDSSNFDCVCSTGDTGYLSPTAYPGDTGRDGDGFETDLTNAFADDSVPASNVEGGGDRHRFSTYGMSLKSSSSISGIEVRRDWWLSALGGGNSMGVELSWDNGSSWTAAKTDPVESTSERLVVLGSSSDDWGRTASSSEFADGFFLIWATINGSGSPTYFLDWAPVKFITRLNPTSVISTRRSINVSPWLRAYGLDIIALLLSKVMWL